VPRLKKLDPVVQEMFMHVQPTPMIDNHMSTDDRVDKIAGHFTQIMKILGLDLNDDSLRDTPKRVAKT
jgi:GTP cyclohydrolase IA